MAIVSSEAPDYRYKGWTREDQTKNGVRVIVHRKDGNTVVDASCQCFGSGYRTHSNPNCPNRHGHH